MVGVEKIERVRSLLLMSACSLPSIKISEMTSSHAASAVPCECSYCELVRRDVQVCDVMIRERGRLTTIQYPLDSEQQHEEPVSECLTSIAIAVKDLYKINRPWDVKTVEGPDYKITVECVKKNVWKVCFHARSSVDEDPC